MVDRRRAGDAVDLLDPLLEAVLRDRAGWRRDDDIRPEGQLGVDPGLLVVGRREDPEVDAEGQQERRHDEAAIDRGAAPACAGQEEAGRGRRPLPRRSAGDPGDRAAAGSNEQQRRPEPEQSRGQEHVDRERQRRVRVRVDDRGEAGPRGEPVDEAADGESQHVEVEALPQRLAGALHAAARVDHGAAEGGKPGADPRRRGAEERQRDADRERHERARRPDRAGVADEVAHREQRRTGSERAGQEADHGALGSGQLQQVAPRGTARAKQPEVAAVAFHRPERGEVRERQRDERPGDGEHHVERLGVERVARRPAQVVSPGCPRTAPGPGTTARRGCGSGSPASAPRQGSLEGPAGRPGPGPATGSRAGRPEPPTSRGSTC